MTMADETEPSLNLSCPRCFSGNIRRRQSVKSVAVWFGALIAPFSLAFGKNRCKDCGHKWR